MAGNTAAGNIEGFVYVSMNAIYQTALSFVSQNVGAGQQKRIPQKFSIYCMGNCILLSDLRLVRWHIVAEAPCLASIRPIRK